MDRRQFIKVCGGVSAACAGAQTGLIQPAFSAELMTYQKVKLVDDQGKPLQAKSLTTTEAYVFHYPMQGTPCFLINLEKPAGGGVSLKTQSGEDYTWKGGAGPENKIVAYSAICTHQLAYPGKAISPITYNTQKSAAAGGASGMIVCCAHITAFDPAQGGKVVLGPPPLPQPLATIQLEHDAATDELYATGVYGGTVYDDFFTAFKVQLNEEFGRGAYKKEVADTAAAVPLSKYTTVALSC
jgi:arsenite oxidase small subunit